MKIIYLAPTRIPGAAANTVQIMKMCAALAELGHEVTLVCGPGGQERLSDHGHYGVPDSFEIVKLPWPRVKGGAFLHARAVYRWVRRLTDVDLLYARSPYALWACKDLGIPFIYEIHSSPRTRFHAAVEQAFLGHDSCVRLVAISEALQVFYRDRFGGGIESKSILARDGADPIPVGTQPSTAIWPGRVQALKAGYVGHLYPGRGIEIIRHLARTLDSMDFHVVGGTESHQLEWRRLGELSNLHWHGFIPHQQIAPTLLRFDILLAPYQKSVRASNGVDTVRWMSPLKVFEYMAAGRAIVASDLPALREILDHRETAILINPDDRDGWVNAVERLSEDEALRSALGQRARAVFEACFTWTERARTILDTLG